MMSQVFDGNHFPLLERLRVAVPILERPTVAVYSGRDTGVDTTQFTYFALSVFWRASVHTWRAPHGGGLWQSLGIYEEPIRTYLLGETNFPSDVAVVAVVCTDYQSQGSVFTPAEIKGNPYTSYWFLARGIALRLFVGPGLPAIIRDSYSLTLPRTPILVSSCAQVSGAAFAYLNETSRSAKNFRG